MFRIYISDFVRFTTIKQILWTNFIRRWEMLLVIVSRALQFILTESKQISKNNFIVPTKKVITMNANESIK